MTPFAIAGVQMRIGNQNNLEDMTQRIDTLMSKYPWVQMVVFSELAAFGVDRKFAQEMLGPAEEHFQAIAQKYDLWLLPGSMFEKRDGLIFNTESVINPQGDIVARYSKMLPTLMNQALRRDPNFALLTYQMWVELEYLFVMIFGFLKLRAHWHR